MGSIMLYVLLDEATGNLAHGAMGERGTWRPLLVPYLLISSIYELLLINPAIEVVFSGADKSAMGTMNRPLRMAWIFC